MDLYRSDWCGYVLPLLTKNMLCAGTQDTGKDACQVMGWALPGKGGWLFCPVGEIPQQFLRATVINNHKVGGFNQHT